jgi:hypothetical protein
MQILIHGHRGLGWVDGGVGIPLMIYNTKTVVDPLPATLNLTLRPDMIMQVLYVLLLKAKETKKCRHRDDDDDDDLVEFCQL